MFELFVSREGHYTQFLNSTTVTTEVKGLCRFFFSLTSCFFILFSFWILKYTVMHVNSNAVFQVLCFSKNERKKPFLWSGGWGQGGGLLGSYLSFFCGERI